MLLGSAPFSLVGVGLSAWLSHRYGDGFEDTAAIVLGIALIAGGVGFALKTFLTGRAKSDAPFILTATRQADRLLPRRRPAASSSGSLRSVAAPSSGS